MIREKRWHLFPSNQEVAQRVSDEMQVHPVTAQVMLNRNIRSLKSAREFMDVSSCDYKTFLQKDLSLVNTIICEAISSSQPILVFGDYDVDGMTSTSMMVSFLRFLGATVFFHIPSRFTEGYGLHAGIIDRMKHDNVGVLLTLDCGVTNVDEIRMIKEQTSAKVIVMDHHTIPDISPNYDVMLNPRSLDKEHPLFWLCTAGIVYEYIRYHVNTHSLNYDYDSLLGVVALGTVADIAKINGANRRYVSLGLQDISRRKHVGLTALLNVAECYKKEITTRDIGFVIAPRLNAAGRLAHAGIGVDLLLSETFEKAEVIANRLEKLNQERRQIDADILSESIKLTQDSTIVSDSVVVVSGLGWHAGVIGITASKLVNSTGKPAVVISDDGEMAVGSARSIGNVSIYNLLKSCSSFFEKFGGHKEAAGFSLKSEKIPAFKQALIDSAAVHIEQKDLLPVLSLDMFLESEFLSLNVIEDLKRLEPFGEGNHMPLFYTDKLTPVDYRTVGDGRHVKVTFRDNEKGIVIDGIGFNLSHLMPLLNQKKPKVAFHLDINEWQGSIRPQLHIVDIK